MHIRQVKARIRQPHLRGARACTAQQVLTQVNAGGAHPGVLLRKPAGIKAGPAAQLDHVRPRCRILPVPQRFANLFRVVVEKVFAAQRVEPATTLKEAIRFGWTSSGHCVCPDLFLQLHASCSLTSSGVHTRAMQLAFVQTRNFTVPHFSGGSIQHSVPA